MKSIFLAIFFNFAEAIFEISKFCADPGFYLGGEIFDKGHSMISRYLNNFPREFVAHGLGIGSHEQPRANHVNKTVLEGPAVMCIEYSYYHDGVRHHTEDTFLVTDKGVENWTANCPRDLVVPV